MVLKIALVIPVYNNPATIAGVVREALAQTRQRIWVVDDGSETPVDSLLSGPDFAAARDQQRLNIFRFEKNSGKGAALRWAISHLVTQGYTHMLTLDGDGQHPPADCQKLIEAALSHPWDLIIGSRGLEKAENVPTSSRFGRKFSNFWVEFETAKSLSDSQSGMRVYPLFFLQTMNFITRHFDFEIEVLIRLMWKKVNVTEVPVGVFYAPPGKRVTHFHKFKDNLRLSVLNTCLVTLSLARGHRSPLHAALAVALGVVIGSTPFFGLHTLIVAVLALVFRLNAIWMWVGTQISLPFLAPFVIEASLWTGRHFTSGFKAWLLGSLIFGSIAGALLGGATYFLVRRGHQPRKPIWTSQSRGGKWGHGFFQITLKYLGLRPAYFFLWFVVPYFYVFAPTARRALNQYWRLISPNTGWFGRQILAIKHLRRFGQVLLDRAQQGQSSKAQFTPVSHELSIIKERIAHNRGVILLTSHVGVWDLSLFASHHPDLAGVMKVVQFQAHGMTFEKLKNRGAADQNAINTNQSSLSILEIRETLMQGQVLGLMGDRPISHRVELMPFMGRLAAFDTTPFLIASLCQCPLIATFGVKGPGRTYDFFALEPYPAPSSREPLLLRAAVARFAKDLEAMVRKVPDQWFNFYPFWSTAPLAIGAVADRPETNQVEEDLVQLGGGNFFPDRDHPAATNTDTPV
jgi:predicted LPLAT superfamily acyltransferase